MIPSTPESPEAADAKARDWTTLQRTRPCVVALGNFDGVHLGHRHILETLKTRAAELDADPVALTFDPHPREFLFPDRRTSLLTTPHEKAARIAAQGVEPVTLSFDASLATMEAETFVRDVLQGRLRGVHFLMGADHRFGRGARGDLALLRALAGAEHVSDVVPVTVDGVVASSSTIRHRLKEGDIAGANAMLGRPYRIRGTVVPGAARGRLLGFPTANLAVDDARKTLPFGVFGGHVLLGGDGAPVPAVANIGLRPTFHGEAAPTVELHLLDWTGDLYGQSLTFDLEAFIRPEMRFDGPEHLKRQIGEDVAGWRKRVGKKNQRSDIRNQKETRA